ncbi:MAG: hypothetical protein AAF492_10985, partial [Verrucomicrobiota bacterium]
GVTGHSMGGRLTTLVAIDPRVEAAVPSVGGTGFLYQDFWGLPGSGRRMQEGRELYEATMGSEAYWPRIRCPVLFLGSSNDFNAPADLIPRAMSLLPHPNRRLALAPHLNHRFTPDTTVARTLWFEARLKKTFDFPQTPKAALMLHQRDGIPRLKVFPDQRAKQKVKDVNIYYGYDRDPRVRFWRSAEVRKRGAGYEAPCPVFDLEEPLFAFANVTYALKKGVAIPYRNEPVEELTLSSDIQIAYPGRLKDNRVEATDEWERLIDDFKHGDRDWYWLEKENRHHWQLNTRKLCDPKWTGPKDAQLSFAIRSTRPTQLGVVLRANQWRNYNRRPRKTYVALITLSGRGWERVPLSPGNFMSYTGEAPVLRDWADVTELTFQPAKRAVERIRKENRGAKITASYEEWQGELPQFKDVQWVGGSYTKRKKPYLP